KYGDGLGEGVSLEKTAAILDVEIVVDIVVGLAHRSMGIGLLQFVLLGASGTHLYLHLSLWLLWSLCGWSIASRRRGLGRSLIGIRSRCTSGWSNHRRRQRAVAGHVLFHHLFRIADGTGKQHLGDVMREEAGNELIISRRKVL